MRGHVEIEYVTHASLLIQSPDVRLLLDPFYYPELDPILAPSVRNFPPRDIDAERFGRVDFVFSSHEHHDHCHPETLAQLKRCVGKVLLPAARPALAARYLNVGLDDIVYLENRVPVELGHGLVVTSYWDDPIDSMLLIELDGIVILHGNDCMAEIATYSEIAQRRPVDYGFLCSTSIQQLYPLLLPRRPAELERLASEREEQFFEAQLERIDALGPRVLLPYAYTATYVEPDQVALNCYGRLTPPMFRDRLLARRPQLTCWALEPGDVIETTIRTVRPIRSERLWGKDLAEYRRNLVAYSQSLQGVLPKFDAGDPDGCDPQLRAHLAERLAGGVPHAELFSCVNHAVVIHVVGTMRTTSHHVDVRRGVAAPWERGRADQAVPLLEISMPASLMQSMLAGAYDPFMILYTYKVRFKPHPFLGRRRFTAQQEYVLFMAVLITLFVDRDSPLLAEIATARALLGLSPDRTVGP